jgi:fatty acid/phospholipid biosynthesis enzyme
MANRISLDPAGYIDITIDGEQSYMSFSNLMGDALDYLEQLQSQKKRRLGLIDITKESNYTTDTNRAAMEMLESANYDRLAIYGGGRILTEIANAIVLAIGKSSNTKVFKTREDALAWLMLPDEPTETPKE